MPTASGTIPAATAAAEPLLEPPEVRPGKMRVLAIAVVRIFARQAEREFMQVRPPRQHRPEERSPRTIAPSSTGTGCTSGRKVDPAHMASPATGKISLRKYGRPCSGEPADAAAKPRRQRFPGRQLRQDRAALRRREPVHAGVNRAGRGGWCEPAPVGKRSPVRRSRSHEAHRHLDLDRGIAREAGDRDRRPRVLAGLAVEFHEQVARPVDDLRAFRKAGPAFT